MRIVQIVVSVIILVPSLAIEAMGQESSPEQLFEDRIMPIFKSSDPSSCVQCHLASVNLRDYILPSHEATFAALREQGLIDLEEPDESEILKLIRMGEKDVDRGARLIHEKVRRSELEAFSTWIKACCNDPRLRQLKTDNAESVGPDKPIEVVRHARKSRLVESFARNIWSQRMRCFPCHTPHELDSTNPKHEVAIKRHEDLVRQFGQKMNIFRETPEDTLDALIASSRRSIPGRFPLINLDDPVKSLLVLKPTAKLPAKKDDGSFERPSSSDPVSHMGGLKMHVNDQSYKSFVMWMQDYSNVVGDKYVDVADLPTDNWIPTRKVVRLKDLPDSWQPLTAVQVFIYPSEAAEDTEPIAFTQCLVTPRRMAMGPLSVFGIAIENSDSADDALSPGEYQIRIYLDDQDRLREHPEVLLNSEDFVGQLEIDAEWQNGFPNAEVVSLSDVK